MITKNSVKQWVDYDVSPAKCTPHVLPPSHTSAPFGLDDQPPTKEPLAFDRVYDTRFDGKDTESHVVLGSYVVFEREAREFKSPALLSYVITRIAITSLVSLIYITRKSLEHQRLKAHSNVTKN